MANSTGAAWAIQDGILEAIGERWRDLRMIKVVGKHAEATRFREANY